MSVKFILLLLLPILVIATSGCIGPTTGGAGNGVSIVSFTPDLPQIHSGDPVKLEMKIENLGDARAKDVIAELTMIDPSEWGGMGFIPEQRLGDLMPYDSETQTGGSRTTRWNLVSPLLSKGIERTYDPVVKLSYDYRTEANKPITIVDQDELRRIIQQGRSLPSKPTEYTSGPFRVEITTENYVKSSHGFEKTYDIFPIHIKVINVLWEQGGTVIPRALYSGMEDYPVEVIVTPPEGTSFVYSGYGDDCSNLRNVKDLWKGKELDITCELEVTNPPEYRQEKFIKIELIYRYSIEAKTQLRVIGTEEPGRF